MLWTFLGELAVSARLDQNSTLQDLRRFLWEEWARIPQQTILRRIGFVNAGVIMVDIHIIDFSFTFLDDPCKD